MSQKLLEAIQERQQKHTEFGYGILTADRYVRNVLDAIGVDKCYRYAATRSVSWNDVMEKAAHTLVYSNPDMITEEISYSKRAGSSLKEYDDIELPKNTLMVFKHVLTTPRKDRDGDVLRTQGASVDPKMLLLWQHVHTMPIGKMLTIAEHNSKKLTLVSCIVDMNDLSHDAAVMIDNDMGRFSHGFRAIEFNKIKAEGGHEGGFDVTAFEIMEASLVSVPSNTDADVEEVILSLVEGRKLTSPIMKEVGRSIREKQPTRITLPVDLKITLNGKEISNEELSGSGSDATKGAGEEQDGTRTSEKADAKAGDGKAEEAATDTEMKCPKCGAMMPKSSKKCPKCGHVMTAEDLNPEKSFDGEKSGRALSCKNLDRLKEIHGDMKELHTGSHIMSPRGRDLCEKCVKGMGSMIEEHDRPDRPEEEEENAEGEGGMFSRGKRSMEDAIGQVISNATPQQRDTIRKTFDALDKVEGQNKLAEEFRTLVSSDHKG